MIRYAMLSDDSCHLYTFHYSRQHKHRYIRHSVTSSDKFLDDTLGMITTVAETELLVTQLNWIKTSLMQLILQHV